MHLIGERTYLKESQYVMRTDNFTGVALFYDWNNHFLSEVIKGNANLPNSRLRSTCTLITLYWWSTSYMGNHSYTSLVAVDHLLTCVNSNGGELYGRWGRWFWRLWYSHYL